MKRLILIVLILFSFIQPNVALSSENYISIKETNPIVGKALVELGKFLAGYLGGKLIDEFFWDELVEDNVIDNSLLQLQIEMNRAKTLFNGSQLNQILIVLNETEVYINKFKTLSEDYYLYKNQSESRILSINKELTKLIDGYGTLESKYRVLEQRISALEGQIDYINRQINQLSARMDSLETKPKYTIQFHLGSSYSMNRINQTFIQERLSFIPYPTDRNQFVQSVNISSGFFLNNFIGLQISYSHFYKQNRQLSNEDVAYLNSVYEVQNTAQFNGYSLSYEVLVNTNVNRGYYLYGAGGVVIKNYSITYGKTFIENGMSSDGLFVPEKSREISLTESILTLGHGYYINGIKIYNSFSVNIVNNEIYNLNTQLGFSIQLF